MKMTSRMILAVMLSTSALADQPVTTPASSPEITSTNTAPAAQPAKRTAKRKPAPPLRTVPLVPGQAVVVANRVNVRGQGKLKSEVITQESKGDLVTVIEEVHLRASGPEEPSAWAKIVLPAKAHVWVNATYIDRTNNMTVIPTKLNVRGGPGEHYSVLGTLRRGDTVKELSTKGEWIEIEPPPGAYAFMAAQYLSQEPAAIASATPETPAATNAVTEGPTVASTTTEMTTETPTETVTATNEVATATNEVASTTNMEMVTAPETPSVEEPPPPRIVQREGLVRGTVSIQAPTKYELISPDNRRVINYLYTTAPDLDLSRYKGLHIIVTGEEGLDARWKNAPVLTIERIQVID